MDAPIIERLKNTGYLDRIFIDGQWRMPAGLARSAVINPATEQPIAQIALGNAQDVAAAVAAAKQALQSWSATSSQIRAVLLDRVHRMILDRAEQLAQAISLEMGAAITFARGTQIPIAAEHIRMARELARRRPLLGDREGMTMLREPVGVCGLVTPWNWSLHQITGEVGRALAAGRAVVLKPGKGSPLSAVLFAEIISDAGIPPGVFNLVHGDAREVAAALALHTDVDMVPSRARRGPMCWQPRRQRRQSRRRKSLTASCPISCCPMSTSLASSIRAWPRYSVTLANPLARPLACSYHACGWRKSNDWRGMRQPPSSWATRACQRPHTGRLPASCSSIACRSCSTPASRQGLASFAAARVDLTGWNAASTYAPRSLPTCTRRCALQRRRSSARCW